MNFTIKISLAAFLFLILSPLHAQHAQAVQSAAEIQAFLRSLQMQPVWDVTDDAGFDEIEQQMQKLSRETMPTYGRDADVDEDDGC